MTRCVELSGEDLSCYFNKIQSVDLFLKCLYDDRRQFITPSVDLCVQHGRRDAARRAGPSATADTCIQ